MPTGEFEIWVQILWNWEKDICKTENKEDNHSKKKHENELTKPPVVTSGARSWSERDGELKKLLETVHCLSVLKFMEEQWFVFLQNGWGLEL